MGIPLKNILTLNKSRQRAVYWRQDDKGGWFQTDPLPADPASMNYYLMKGFKGKKPEQGDKPVEVKTDGEISCPICEFKAKSVFGLQAHLRKHITK